MVVTTLLNIRPDLVIDLWKIAQENDLSFSNFNDSHVIVKNDDNAYTDASEDDAKKATGAWYSDTFKPLDNEPVTYTKQEEADFYSFNAFVLETD